MHDRKWLKPAIGHIVEHPRVSLRSIELPGWSLAASNLFLRVIIPPEVMQKACNLVYKTQPVYDEQEDLEAKEENLTFMTSNRALYGLQNEIAKLQHWRPNKPKPLVWFRNNLLGDKCHDNRLS